MTMSEAANRPHGAKVGEDGVVVGTVGARQNPADAQFKRKHASEIREVCGISEEGCAELKFKCRGDIRAEHTFADQCEQHALAKNERALFEVIDAGADNVNLARSCA